MITDIELKIGQSYFDRNGRQITISCIEGDYVFYHGTKSVCVGGTFRQQALRDFCINENEIPLRFEDFEAYHSQKIEVKTTSINKRFVGFDDTGKIVLSVHGNLYRYDEDEVGKFKIINSCK